MWQGIDVGALLGCYLVFINIAAACVCWQDKRAARRRAWRVPERTLFVVAAAGGSAGLYLAMRACRHQTQHKRFMIGVPLMLIAQVALAVWGIAE